MTPVYCLTGLNTSFRRGDRARACVVTVTHVLRIVATATVVTLAVDLAIAYWWLSFGPFPESAWP